VALELILRFDETQDFRPLSPEEHEFRKTLKRWVTSLAIRERARKKQSARMVNLKEGDANTKYFHMKINARRRRNFTLRLKRGAGWVTKHEDIEHTINAHFAMSMKKGPTRSRDFSWDNIPLLECDLSSLAEDVTEGEVHEAVKALPSDKAPGPDGFTGLFFKVCWATIKEDLMRVINLFSNLHYEKIHWLNSANIVLLPKKDGAESITDFRPVSLIHAVAKIVTKMMATRLAPFMNTLISRSQSAFIKTRSIHDNYLYVSNYARRLHKAKTPALLLKLDIKKAFDSVQWDYLVDLLQRLGFPPRFWNWLVAILRSASSRVLLNGVPCSPLAHGQGLRQGDPLSPLLFVLAIGPLQAILTKATENGNLHRLRGRATTMPLVENRLSFGATKGFRTGWLTNPD
jgi:hypothetical protein